MSNGRLYEHTFTCVSPILQKLILSTIEWNSKKIHLILLFFYFRPPNVIQMANRSEYNNTINKLWKIVRKGSTFGEKYTALHILTAITLNHYHFNEEPCEVRTKDDAKMSMFK